MNADDQSSPFCEWCLPAPDSNGPVPQLQAGLWQGAGDRVSGFLGGAAKSYAGTYKDEDHTEVPLCVAQRGSAAYWCWIDGNPMTASCIVCVLCPDLYSYVFCSLIVRICNAKTHLNVNHVEYSNPWLSDRPGLCRADWGQTWRYRHGTLEPGWPTSS